MITVMFERSLSLDNGSAVAVRLEKWEEDVVLLFVLHAMTRWDGHSVDESRILPVTAKAKVETADQLLRRLIDAHPDNNALAGKLRAEQTAAAPVVGDVVSTVAAYWDEYIREKEKSHGYRLADKSAGADEPRGSDPVRRVSGRRTGGGRGRVIPG